MREIGQWMGIKDLGVEMGAEREKQNTGGEELRGVKRGDADCDR